MSFLQTAACRWRPHRGGQLKKYSRVKDHHCTVFVGSFTLDRTWVSLSTVARGSVPQLAVQANTKHANDGKNDCNQQKDEKNVPRRSMPRVRGGGRPRGCVAVCGWEQRIWNH